MAFLELFNNVLQRPAESFRELSDEETTKQAQHRRREPTIDAYLRRKGGDEWGKSTPDHAHHARPTVSQTASLSRIEFCNVYVENRPKTTKNESVDHQSDGLKPRQSWFVVIRLKKQKNSKHEAHAWRYAQSQIRGPFSGKPVNHKLCSYIAKHFTDSKNDLIYCLAEAHVAQIESGGVVDGLNPHENEASRNGYPPQTFVFEEILDAHLAAFLLLHAPRLQCPKFLLSNNVLFVYFTDLIQQFQREVCTLLNQVHRGLLQTQLQGNIRQDKQQEQYRHNRPPRQLRKENKGDRRFAKRKADLHAHSETLPRLAQTLLINERKSKRDGRVRPETDKEKPEADDPRRIWHDSDENRYYTDHPGHPQRTLPSRIIGDIRYHEESHQSTEEQHRLKDGDLALEIVTNHVILELECDGKRVRGDGRRTLPWGQRANIGLAAVTIGVVWTETAEWVIEEKWHAEEQPRGEEPEQAENYEGYPLEFTLTVDTVD